MVEWAFHIRYVMLPDFRVVVDMIHLHYDLTSLP